MLGKSRNSIPLEVDSSIMENKMRIIKDTINPEFNAMYNIPDTLPSRMVKPMPGLCLKTFTKPDNKKLFINICTTDAIPCPKDITDKELMEIISSENPSEYRVPMSLGEGRSEQDKSGEPVTVCDVAIHPTFFKKILESELFKTFLVTVIFEGLQDKYQFEIDMQKYIILKNRKSIGTLQSHRIQVRDIQMLKDCKKPPLIEEISNTPTSAIPEVNTDDNKFEIAYRMILEPPHEAEFLVAEFKIPASVDLNDLDLEIGEDRVVLDTKGLYKLIDFYMPVKVDRERIDAQLNRNNDTLVVKMPVIN